MKTRFNLMSIFATIKAFLTNPDYNRSEWLKVENFDVPGKLPVRWGCFFGGGIGFVMGGIAFYYVFLHLLVESFHAVVHNADWPDVMVYIHRLPGVLTHPVAVTTAILFGVYFVVSTEIAIRHPDWLK